MNDESTIESTTETLEDIEKEGQALREQINAQQEAANAGFDAPPKAEQAEAIPAEPETPPAEEKPTGKQRNEKGQFVKQGQAQPEAQPAQPENTAAPVEPEKPESNYSKAKKDAERKDRSWKALEAEKEQTRAQQAELQRQRAEFEAFARQQAQQQQRQQQTQDNSRFSPEEFERAAEWYDNEAAKAIQNGDLDKYNELTNNAKLTRKAAKQAATQQQQTQEQQAMAQFRDQYEASANRVFEKEPELANADSEMGKRMVALLQQKPILQMIPNGFEEAYEYLQLQDKANGHDDAVARAEKAEAEVARLTKLTQPASGSPAAPSDNSGSNENAPLAEQERFWRNKVYSGGSVVR